MTVLFADICDFDSVVSNYREKIVDILDEVFLAFDTLCNKHQVQKIEVSKVGDHHRPLARLIWLAEV